MQGNSRFSIFIAAIASCLLASCATSPDIQPRTVTQVGALQIHPGLINPSWQPIPEEIPEILPVAAPTVDQGKIKLDYAKLRNRRSIYFDYKASEIEEQFSPIVQAHARYLARHPTARVRLEGHADQRASPSYNLLLALQRADAVRRALLEQGARNSQIKVVSLGEIKPRQAGPEEESRAENRRTDIVYEQE